LADGQSSYTVSAVQPAPQVTRYTVKR
jgi:hypothetical protein